MERLATGKQINRASDDPAGMITSVDLKVRERQIHEEVKGLDRSSAYYAAREGAASVTGDLMIELKGLVIRGANRSAMTEDERNAIQDDVDSIIETVDFLANSTTFNGQQIIDGLNSGTLGAGYVGGQDVSLRSLRRGGVASLLSGDLEIADGIAERAVSQVSDMRAGLGRIMQANDRSKNILLGELESVGGARSAIEDTDFARETSDLIRNKALQDAAAFTEQFAADQRASMVYSLLAPMTKSASAASPGPRLL